MYLSLSVSIYRFCVCCVTTYEKMKNGLDREIWPQRIDHRIHGWERIYEDGHRCCCRCRRRLCERIQVIFIIFCIELESTRVSHHTKVVRVSRWYSYGEWLVTSHSFEILFKYPVYRNHHQFKNSSKTFSYLFIRFSIRIRLKSFFFYFSSSLFLIPSIRSMAMNRIYWGTKMKTKN